MVSGRLGLGVVFVVLGCGAGAPATSASVPPANPPVDAPVEPGPTPPADPGEPVNGVDHLTKPKSPGEERFDQGEWKIFRSPEQPCFEVSFPQVPETYPLEVGGEPARLTLVIAGWDGDMQAVTAIADGTKLEPARLDRLMITLVGAALDEMYGVEFGTMDVDAIAALDQHVDGAGDRFLTVPANATGGAMVARIRTHRAGDGLVLQLGMVREQYAPFLPPLDVSCGE